MSQEIQKPEVCPATIFCAFESCNSPFVPTSNRQRFCSPRCRRRQKYLPAKRATQGRRNDKFRVRTRDFAIGFDGRHGGNRNVSYTTQASTQ